jgi:(E)-4-hydroxy-3-methylbut-2-enyl-diphosphate synthase
MIQRRASRPVKVGNLTIGGGAPVSIQSMTNLPLENVEETIAQVNALHEQGAEIVRLAVRSVDAVQHLKQVIDATDVLLCADIHFDYRIAIEAIKAGINKVRINPGNIGDESRVREVIAAAKDNGVPIRIGVNGGSLDRKKYAEAIPENMVASAMDHVRILEDNNFEDIIVSIKSSHIAETLKANELFAQSCDYPLHIGLTEAGYGLNCVIQSSVALGHLLMQGIGDTMRVSMTGDPVEEVVVAQKILESVGERKAVVRVVSCPTCGRTAPEIDLLSLAKEVDLRCTSRYGDQLKQENRTLTVAVMGCEVNGPGEAADADFGIAGGRFGSFLIFARGEKTRKVEGAEVIDALISEIDAVFLKK